MELVYIRIQERMGEKRHKDNTYYGIGNGMMMRLQNRIRIESFIIVWLIDKEGMMRRRYSSFS